MSITLSRLLSIQNGFVRVPTAERSAPTILRVQDVMDAIPGCKLIQVTPTSRKFVSLESVTAGTDHNSWGLLDYPGKSFLIEIPSVDVRSATNTDHFKTLYDLAVPDSSVAAYRNLSEIFDSDLVSLYDHTSMYKDLGKTDNATSPGDTIVVWADTVGSSDLEITLESLYANGMPGPLVYSSTQNGFPAFGSGNIYDATTGNFYTDEGDPGVNGIYNGFLDGSFDNTIGVWNVFMVLRNQIADNPLIQITKTNQSEYHALFGADHHVTGSILQNLILSNIQAYEGPNGINAWNDDGTWRVAAASFAWDRTKNALWVNGTKYSAGDGLPVQGAVDSGASADLLIPSVANDIIVANDSVPQTFLGIVSGEQEDADILEACRYLGQLYGIDVV